MENYLIEVKFYMGIKKICEINDIDRLINMAIFQNLKEKSCHLAVLVRGNMIKEYGYNRRIGSVHAEIDCLKNYNPKTHKGCELIIIKIFRFNRVFTGKCSDSRPCDQCTKFMKRLNIKTFYASTDDNDIKKYSMDDYVPLRYFNRRRDFNGMNRLR